MHIEMTFTEGHAEDVWNSVRGFTQRLASKAARIGSWTSNSV